MKQWDRSRLEECLDQAMETYTDLLVEYDFSEDDNFEHDLMEKIRNEDYIIEDVDATDLHKFTSFHTAMYDLEEMNPELESRMYSGYIVIFYNETHNMVLDGNHRKNTHYQLATPLMIPVVKIYCKKIPKVQE